MSEVHEMRVDSVDRENRVTVFQCDECPRRLMMRGTYVEILNHGDLVDHRGRLGGLVVKGMEVT